MVQFKTGGESPENQDPDTIEWPKEAPPKKVSHYHAQKPPKLWTFVYWGTIIWALAIWILYPVWPSVSEYTLGTLGYSTRIEHTEAVSAMAAERAPNKEWVLTTDVTALKDDPAQYQTAVAAGKTLFALNCSQCHGGNGTGSKGFPDLTDSDWLWPSDLEEIEFTIKHGIRQPDNDETRVGDMLAFVKDQMLDRDDALDAAHYVLSLSGSEHSADRAERGTVIFEENCASCHGDDGKGISDMGAPNLTDTIWLYGGELEAVYKTIAQGRAGVMPAWSHRLDDGTIRQLALFVLSLSESGQAE